MDAQTLESYRWCRALCSRSGSSFCWTFVLLPPAQRSAMYALYAFARITDDLSDGVANTDVKREALNKWLHRTEQLLTVQIENESAVELRGEFDSVWPALRHASIEYQIPNRWLVEIVRGVMMDLDHRPPRDWGKADDYCYHVASAVGLACTKIWEARPKCLSKRPSIAASPFSLPISFAMSPRCADGSHLSPAQRTESLWDRFKAMVGGRTERSVRDAIQSVADRAESLYASGWRIIDYLPSQSRRCFR